ncbi:hypothetical protein Patl1_11518 [Pistacia atlantica]|uniref:Uncharacterized protein n=1 Tax=Pistacia atlantica TaxID=434234 RepID=A0ACC1A7Z3_9ROSI|nr:hypothetical protein Patl1_11518 [Pistacia atlantica]
MLKANLGQVSGIDENGKTLDGKENDGWWDMIRFENMVLMSDHERSTEKWLFGLDDIKEAAEIIIVEGEMDKLEMEEAGFLNCVNVPCGAPQKASARELPPQEKVWFETWEILEHVMMIPTNVLLSQVFGSRCSEGSNRKRGVVSATSSRPSNVVYIKLI